jgi:PilZ domain
LDPVQSGPESTRNQDFVAGLDLPGFPGENMYRRIVNLLSKLSSAPSDLRRSSRIPEPKIVAYYWDGSEPNGHGLRDISLTGAYLYTTERWYPGTIVRLLLQERRIIAGIATCTERPVSVSIPSRVMWAGADGVALDFLFVTPQDQKLLTKLIACGEANHHGESIPEPAKVELNEAHSQ